MDYILTWSPEGNPVSFSTDTLIVPHSSHDHHFLKAKFSSSLIIRPTVSEAEVRYPSLNFKEWPKHQKAWEEAVDVTTREVLRQNLDPLTTMEVCWKKSYTIAYELIGHIPTGVKVATFTNKTTRRLLKHLKHLLKAMVEMKPGTTGNNGNKKGGSPLYHEISRRR